MWEDLAVKLASSTDTRLGFLAELFERQRIVHERAEELLRAERKPLEDGVLMAFLAFLSKTTPAIYPVVESRGPEALREGLKSLGRASSDDMLELLAVYALDDRIPKAALVHLPDPLLCRWFARVFLLPASEYMYDRAGAAAAGRCPRCRHRPQLLLRKGAYVCALCFFAWMEAGAACPSCGSAAWRAADSPLIELIVCPDCRTYLKRVGDDAASAWALELESVDLDERARREGWTKIEPNLLLR